ncbi:MAG: nucleoside triphosphate pyrophosphatase [bacterium]
MQKVILASGSTRRKEILERLGVEFAVVESGFDESLVTTDDPIELAEELALQKVLEVAKKETDAIVIGGDTVVEVDGEMIGKPGDAADATRMLKLLSGNDHRVVSGVAVINSLTGERLIASDVTYVKFRELSTLEIELYVASKAWKGFAGGYAIQGRAAPFVLGYKGNLSTIIGFPIVMVSDFLEQMGVSIEEDPKELELHLSEHKTGLEGTGNE